MVCFVLIFAKNEQPNLTARQGEGVSRLGEGDQTRARSFIAAIAAVKADERSRYA
jgi:hypothetical protein